MGRTLARWVKEIAAEHVPDCELLHRFLIDRDQAAFELLVHRYGPMVLGLCRRLLSQLADAEDAFQATFLTLAHQARRIKKQQSLGSWLYKVAWRMCQRQHRRRTVRAYESEPASTADSPVLELQQREVAEVLARELDRLSECLRSVVVLCCLRGLSSKEAAKELGCPANTVNVRLRRARELLKKRLQQRGYLLASGIAATLGINSSAAHLGLLALPLSQTALQVSSQGLASGLLSPSVACLLKGALLTMWLKPIQLTVLAVASLGMLTVPFWNGGAPVQAQPPDHVLLNRFYYSTYDRTHKTPQVHATYPRDENLPEEARKWIDEQLKQEEVIRAEAEQKMRGMRMGLHGKLKQLQETYTKAGDLDRALAIREQVRRLELAVSQAVVYRNDSSQVAQFRGQTGKSIIFSVRGQTEGSVWGDGIYTDDSDLATAAVHAGLLQPGQTGLIKVTIMPGRETYTSATHHGVTSAGFQVFPGSMRVERAEFGTEVK
ncbi:MAG TPA: sigma-70 family RNA polymerase sigma factor [Gemmatales bacterium]|nr:sigma-70 family RNA polymerase sigma factor [Gemmatales bacterium]